MEYNFKEIERKWQQAWAEEKTYHVEADPARPKYYVLNMFPYPSGAGLHVGHPLGYIASDIYARYKRARGFNVLNPMGYDAYGLPAEQYAIQTGQHPAVTTRENIARYRGQLDKMGFSFDWDREVRTCDPAYYHWTQWAFIRMFHSYYDNKLQKARPVAELEAHLSAHGTDGLDAAQGKELHFTAAQWAAMDEKARQEVLMNFRLAYLGETMVNWCPKLGTVLANDEVVDGLSVRGGHPVVQRKMKQWCLRVSAYAQRLLDGLETIDWTDSLKETQKNWIGRSEGTEMSFKIASPTPTLPHGGGGEGSAHRTANPLNYPLLKDFARTLRHEPTVAETALWNVLRDDALGVRFRRQHIIGDFIADFACITSKLVIEVDGGYHNEPKQKEYDTRRTAMLQEMGFTELRFTNEEVIGDTEAVVKRIQEALAKNNQSPSPVGEGRGGASLTIFTTRADTIFGVTFMVLAPESGLVAQVTTPERREEVKAYVEATKKRTERERIADRKVTGVFTGAYAVNPFTGKEIPIWVSDYVLAGYGTGAIMAVPAHDSRDYAFARHFNLPVIPLIEGADVSEESFDAKEGIVMNSPSPTPTLPHGGGSVNGEAVGGTLPPSPMGEGRGGALASFSLNGLTVKEAIAATKKFVTENHLGRVKVNYRLRDAIFSRQRYWGEPFPVYYKDGMPRTLPEECLPLRLPEVSKFLPTETGEPPLGNAQAWAWDEAARKVVDKSLIDNRTVFPLELSTMPGFAGSSAYYLRYMDPHNGQALVSPEADRYWQDVDLYIGGSEHATGHLIYSRFWNKFLHDIGVSCREEPFKKLVNQGMIQGRSNFVYRIKDTNRFVSLGLKDKYEVTPIHVDVNIVHGDVLDLEAFRQWRPEYKDAEFELEDGRYVCGWAVEKMSKSMYNVVNPDHIIEKYGADTLRLYEMFLGPINQSKPWDSNGIDGCARFLRKFWSLYYPKGGGLSVSDEAPAPDSLKTLHRLIKKVTGDIEAFSYNTAVPAFMIAAGELAQQQCHSRSVLEPLCVLLAPFAPHIGEELWHALGHSGTVCDAPWPEWDEKYLKEESQTLSVSFNGKTRFTLTLPAAAGKAEIEEAALHAPQSAKYLEGKTVVKVIVVPGRIVNVVIR